MKRIIQIILLLALIGGIFQIIATKFKDNHSINYEIIVNNVSFKVKEIFKNNQYHVLITKGNTNFSFITKNEFNKKKKIVTDIEFVSSGNLICIYPSLYRGNYNIICNDDGQIKSYFALKNHDLVTEFVSSLIDKGENNESWKDTNQKRKADQLIVYHNNLTKNSRIYVWKYTGFNSITKEIDSVLNISDKDIYSNTHGILVDRYYVFPDYNQKYDFTSLIVYDMKTDLLKKIRFDTEISYDSYYNGVVGNSLYLFDKEHLTQYAIDIKKKTYSIVGNKEINALYYDNGFTTRNIYDFSENNLLFKTYEVPTEIIDKKDILKEDSLYFYIENDNMYMFDNELKTKVDLFNMKDIDSIQVMNYNIYFIVKDTLYTYNQKNGIKPLIQYKEFSFNQENMYVIYDY